MTAPYSNVVLVDMDGVVADFDAHLFAVTSGTIDWTPEALNRERRFCTDYVNNRDKKVVRKVVESNGFFRYLPLVPGAQEGVERLSAFGLDVWFCSKPLEASPTCASEKFAWIAEFFPDYVGKLILAPNKGMVRGGVLIDDCVKEAERAMAEWWDITFPYPHNEGVYGHRADWSKAPELANAIIKTWRSDGE